MCINQQLPTMKYLTGIVALLLTTLTTWAQESAFPLPAIPQELATPTERANYLSLHYWDLYDFDDLSLIGNEKVSEQGFADFINLISYATEQTEALDRLASRLTDNNKMLDYFIDMADRHLANSQSPTYNEGLYIMLLESIVTNGDVEPIKQQQVNYYLTMAYKNRTGSTATDLTLLLRDGSYCNLSDIHGTYILLYFGNPDCNMCDEAKSTLQSSEVIAKMVATHQLTVVSICVEGKTDEWLSTPLPCQWIDACDEELAIYDEELYEMDYPPSFYLLDENHRVILRNVSVTRVIDFLKEK